MTLTAGRVRLTYDQFRLLPEDGRRWELIDGGFEVTPSPSPRHQKVSRRLQYELMTQLERTGLAEVINAPIDVILDPTNVVVPDLVIVSTARASLITKRGVEGAPDVLVEIMSPSSVDRDRYMKAGLYARFGVPEYWLIDPRHGFVEAFRLGEQKYELRARYDRAATLTSPHFPTLSIALAPVFED